MASKTFTAAPIPELVRRFGDDCLQVFDANPTIENLFAITVTLFHVAAVTWAKALVTGVTIPDEGAFGGIARDIAKDVLAQARRRGRS